MNAKATKGGGTKKVPKVSAKKARNRATTPNSTSTTSFRSTISTSTSNTLTSTSTSTLKTRKKKGHAKANAASLLAPLPSLDALPDEALNNILRRITDARLLARCAGVCRRWRKLSRQVPSVRLELRKMQAWQAEGILSAALLDRKGLKDFEVRFVCSRKFPLEGIRESRLFGCLWRLCSTIEKLALFCPNTIYFKLWSWLAKFPNLYRLSVHCGRIEEHPAVGCLQRLRRCEFTRTIISGPMLEDLVSICPNLEELIITGCDPIESLSIESSSLKSLGLVATEEYPMRSLDLQTPNLRELSICHVDELQAEGRSLVQLGIYSACQPQIGSLQSLLSLELLGRAWSMEAVEQLICSGQNVRHLILKASISDIKKPMRIEHYLSPMFNLQTLILESNLLECFCDGFASATFDGEPPTFSLSKVAVKLSNETRTSFLTIVRTLLKCCPQLHVIIVDSTEVDGPASEIEQQLLDLDRLQHCQVILYHNPRDLEKRREIANILEH